MTVPYKLERLGVVMRQDPTLAIEADGVLNPAVAYDPDGRLWLLPRLVAAGNVSRVGRAEVLVEGGVPVGVRRAGVVLSPDEGWERGHDHGGVEDPRVTWLPSLGAYVMTYVAFGPLGPRPALAVSADLCSWRRLGPVHFEYDPALSTDLNLFHNKDLVFFPEPVPGPDGEPAYAVLHRPMWKIDARPHLPAGVTDPRPAIWISYVPVDAAVTDIRALTHVSGHRPVAAGEYDWEALKIGAGPPPVRVPEGWLLIHHGVSGFEVEGWGPQQDMVYVAGAMLLDPADPSRVLARTPDPLLEPVVAEEREGLVPNVVFPTAIADIEGHRYVFYGMADTSIGVARLEVAS